MKKTYKKRPAKMTRNCAFCYNNKNEINYKDTELLRHYLSSFGKIVSRKRSGVCMWHQRKLAKAIKRARFMALLPYIVR